MSTSRTQFTQQDAHAFAPDAKVGLLATRTPEGEPHVSLITTLAAQPPHELCWGQFCEGASKDNVRLDPRVGFLVMTLDRKLWRGTARWLGTETVGPDLDDYNRRPMFRYNAYFGIHTVHRMRLRQVRGPEPLSIPTLAVGTLLANAASPLTRQRLGPRALRPWARSLLRSVQTVKFLAWVAKDGHPRLLPAVPAAPAGAGRIAIAALGHRAALRALPRGCPVALFAMNLLMESVLVKGELGAFTGPRGFEVAALDIHQVYNSMPPKQGPVWPPRPPRRVPSFD